MSAFPVSSNRVVTDLLIVVLKSKLCHTAQNSCQENMCDSNFIVAVCTAEHDAVILCALHI